MTWDRIEFTQADMAEFLEAIAAAPALDLSRQEDRLAAARRIGAIDRDKATTIVDAIALRRAMLAAAPSPR